MTTYHVSGRQEFIDLVTQSPTEEPTEDWLESGHTRPYKPQGSADQGVRGPLFTETPREMFIRALSGGWL